MLIKRLLEIYERLRPGEPPTVDNAKSLLVSRFFDPKAIRSCKCWSL